MSLFGTMILKLIFVGLKDSTKGKLHYEMYSVAKLFLFKFEIYFTLSEILDTLKNAAL